jgi:hypothetical protein
MIRLMGAPQGAVPLSTKCDPEGASQTRRRPWSMKYAVGLVDIIKVLSACIGLSGAYLVVAMLSLNVGGTCSSLIFKTGVWFFFANQ